MTALAAGDGAPTLPGPTVAPAPPTGKRLLAATALALFGASVLFATVVLPAEYGVDPFGTGELLGLIVLSDPTVAQIPIREDGLTAHSTSYRVDTRSFELPPDGFVEYKFRLEAGEAMVYTWTATGPVRSEMHSEADGAPQGTAEFFEVEDQTLGRNGTYVAPFPGDHGWYWLNRGADPVTVTIHAAGFFDDSIEYRSDVEPVLREITATPDSGGP